MAVARFMFVRVSFSAALSALVGGVTLLAAACGGDAAGVSHAPSGESGGGGTDGRTGGRAGFSGSAGSDIAGSTNTGGLGGGGDTAGRGGVSGASTGGIGAESGSGSGGDFASDHAYVVERYRLPTTSDEVREFALDIDGDGRGDNAFGMVLATLASYFDAQRAMNEAIDSGVVIVLADLRAGSLVASADASLLVLRGTNAEPVPCSDAMNLGTCRRHLGGTGSFDVDVGGLADEPITGAITGGVFAGDSGNMSLPVMLDSAEPLYVRLVGARARLSEMTDDTIGSGVMGGGLLRSEIDAQVMPYLATNYQVVVERDCNAPTQPDCGCVSGSTGRTVIALFDTTPDCVVTAAEVAANVVINSLFAPDVMIDGQPAMSFGVGVSLAKAHFTSP